MRFITSVYGTKYAGMLLPLLYSVRQSNPEADITVLWQDIGERARLLQKVFPSVEFIDTSRDMGADFVERIANRTLLYKEAIRRYEGELLVFLDIDMLVLKNLAHFFGEREFDVAFTWKDETYPLNMGILLVRASSAAMKFFSAWAEATARILADPELTRMATRREYGYGAPDQMAFNRLIDFALPRTRYEARIDGETIVLEGIPCALLNETNSTAVAADTHIVHYKGGWHSILLDGSDFTPHRPKKESREMYLLYLSTYKDAVAYASRQVGRKLSEDFFGVKIPFYLDPHLSERPALYRLFSLKERVAGPARTFITKVRRRLSSPG